MFAAVHMPGVSDDAALIACACDFSPVVERTGPDTVTFDVRGLGHLFGSMDRLADAIARQASGARVAIAPNPDAAVHAARGHAGLTVIAPGEEARAIGELPVDVLAPPEGVALTLALWGIRTCAQLAALPEEGVTDRLGAAGAHLHKLARGAGDRPLAPAFEPAVFECALELEYPLTLLEPLAFVLARQLNELCAKLDSHGLAAYEIRLILALEDAAPHTRAIRLPYPMRNAKVFLKLLTLDLDVHPPAAPVTRVAIAMEPVNPRVVQHGLFIPQAPEPQKLELTLARIMKIVGEENAGSPEVPDTHRPGAFRMRKFAPLAGTADDKRRSSAPQTHRLGVRVFRPALAAAVQDEGGRPARVAARGIRGKVVASAGPWRTSGDWWREDAWSGDEWDVALSDGMLYRMVRDHREQRWYVAAAYD